MRKWVAAFTAVALLLVSLALIFALTVKFYRNPFDPLDAGRIPVSGEYVGQTKDTILGRFGPPSREWQGHSGRPPVDDVNTRGPTITMTYTGPAGVLYLSYEHVQGEWVCFSSDWVPNGWEID